jgi:hypothetical protein
MLLPLLMLAVSTDWVYSAAGLIDAWLYHGFFHLLDEFAPTNFGRTYYATRLAWILPGYAAYHLMPPHAANLILHLTFFYIAIAAMYRTAAVLTTPAAALISTCAFATATPTIVAFGWDYVDGAVMAYTLVALWAVIEASVRQRHGALILVSGAAAACIVHSNLAAALLIPTIGIAYWHTHRQRNWRDVGWFVCGAVIATSALGACSMATGGDFLFFLPSVRWASNSIGTQTFDPAPPLKWPGSARFVVPLVGIVAVFSAFGVTRTTATRTTSLMLAWLIAAFIGYDWGTSGAMLQTQYYVSWFLPLGFLGLAAALAPVSTGSSVMISAAIVAVDLPSLVLMPNQLHQYAVAALGQRMPVIEIAVVGATLLIGAAMGVWRIRIQPAVLAAVFVAANFVATTNLGYGITREGRSQFDTVQQTLAFIRSHVPAPARPLFWIQAGSRNSHYFDSLASTYLYMYSLVSFTYPSLLDESGRFPKPGSEIERGSYVLVTSDMPVDPAAIDREVQRYGMQAAVVASMPVRAEGTSFMLTLLRIS